MRPSDAAGDPVPLHAARLTKLAETWRASEIEECGEQIERSTIAIENLSAQLRSAVATLHDARRHLAELQQHDERREADPVASILSHPDVVSVRVDHEELIVTTRLLEMRHAAERYDIGSFEFTLSRESGVQIRQPATSRKSAGGWIHPHVQGSRPCLGSARVGVEKLLALGEFAAVVDVLVRFLGSYDDETAYCPIGLWPRLDHTEEDPA